jgi:hypothetical protein
VHHSKLYGRLIIEEARMIPMAHQPEMRLVQPVNFGGIAGGDKYKYSGILFKFAEGRLIVFSSITLSYLVDVALPDESYLYGGKSRRDDYASKSAGFYPPPLPPLSHSHNVSYLVSVHVIEY